MYVAKFYAGDEAVLDDIASPRRRFGTHGLGGGRRTRDAGILEIGSTGADAERGFAVGGGA